MWKTVIIFYCLSSCFSEGALQLLRDFLHYGVLQTVPIRTKVAGVWCHRFNQGLWYKEPPPKKKICCITINKYSSEWLFRTSVSRNCPCCHGVWIAFRTILFLWMFCATQNTNSKACSLLDMHVGSSRKRQTLPHHHHSMINKRTNILSSVSNTALLW